MHRVAQHYSSQCVPHILDIHGYGNVDVHFTVTLEDDYKVFGKLFGVALFRRWSNGEFHFFHRVNDMLSEVLLLTPRGSYVKRVSGRPLSLKKTEKFTTCFKLFFRV